jgi:predicted CXXCH cytochrome family protein
MSNLLCYIEKGVVLGQVSLPQSLGALLFLMVALPLHGQADGDYVGADACAKCHANLSHKWAESLHSKIMQPATERSVEGDFAVSKVVLRGATYLLRHHDGSYFITESTLRGTPWEHHVDYTLGGRRIQQYLTTLPDGRIILMPATWDRIRKKWVHDFDVDNPEEDARAQVQIWNKTCYSCHVSQGQRNFDLEHNRYHTTWQNFGDNCERCHGPGSKHVAGETGTKAIHGETPAVVDRGVVNPARLDPVTSTMVCAQCHSLRDIYVESFRPGANYYDFFLPVMEYRLPASEDPPYWPDGRPRWLSNEALAFWQSECFLRGGATCVTCHSDAHSINVNWNPQLRRDNNTLCTKCHKALAANISMHTHHAPKSSGSLCLECHMPPTVTGLRTRMRDHSINVPVPENTTRHGIPNACNLCHKDRNAEWASRHVNAWFGDQSRQKLILRADAFTEARNSNSAAIPALLQILSDPSEGPFIRANAAGYLGNFPGDPSAYDVVRHSFSDPEPLVRATAAIAIKPRAAQREAVAPELVSLLGDPVTTVRISAVIALVAMGVRQVPDEATTQFERAKELYRARAEHNADDAQQQFAAGRFFFLAGDMDSAVAFFRGSLKLDPMIPAQYNLAQALAARGDSQTARQILEAIPRNDQQYDLARQFLAFLELNDVHHGDTPLESTATKDSDDARAAFLGGQLSYQNENYGAALKQLELALGLAPQASWATKAQVYRAICLEKLARTQEAEAAMQALSGNAASRDDVDLQLAFAELFYETGRAEEALKRIDEVIAAAPQAPMAYFWRAKVLLQLHRTAEAASAAEEAVRLLPELPLAHNLLIRIYQMQGRTKEAAEQVQWLRNYERRKE